MTFDSTFYDVSDEEITKYHSDEYLDLLKNINEQNFQHYHDHFTRFGFSGDCPCPTDSKFYDFCKLYTGGNQFKFLLFALKTFCPRLKFFSSRQHPWRQAAQ
jgi:hypothetical protein